MQGGFFSLAKGGGMHRTAFFSLFLAPACVSTSTFTHSHTHTLADSRLRVNDTPPVSWETSNLSSAATHDSRVRNSFLVKKSKLGINFLLEARTSWPTIPLIVSRIPSA